MFSLYNKKPPIWRLFYYFIMGVIMDFVNILHDKKVQ